MLRTEGMTMPGKKSTEERKRDFAEKKECYSAGPAQGDRICEGRRKHEANEEGNWPLQYEWLRRVWK